MSAADRTLAPPGALPTLLKRAVLPLRHVIGYGATQALIDFFALWEA